ncbi:hypothetical protein FS847_18470 [Streptomyces sp. ISID311]|nr:hypothetical protein FS847_18470 [Streptomyces sp. ISID311]
MSRRLSRPHRQMTQLWEPANSEALLTLHDWSYGDSTTKPVSAMKPSRNVAVSPGKAPSWLGRYSFTASTPQEGLRLLRDPNTVELDEEAPRKDRGTHGTVTGDLGDSETCTVDLLPSAQAPRCGATRARFAYSRGAPSSQPLSHRSHQLGGLPRTQGSDLALGGLEALLDAPADAKVGLEP